MKRRSPALLGILLLALLGQAHADPVHVFRVASVAPAGTAWAREFKAFSAEIARITEGKVVFKWYLGGIAGGDYEAADRLSRGQLDGFGAGVWLCDRYAPLMRVSQIPALAESPSEAAYVLSQLRPDIDKEFQAAGFVDLGLTTIGPHLMFTRNPVHSFAELKRVRFWTLDNDPKGNLMLKMLGLDLVPLPFFAANQAYDAHRVDGYLGPPTAAVAFQWDARARYWLDLSANFIGGCFLVTSRSFDRLSIEQQQELRGAAAKLVQRFNDVSVKEDAQLLNGLLGRQGLKKLPVSPEFRRQFKAAARQVREQILPAPLLERIDKMLYEFRLTHDTPRD